MSCFYNLIPKMDVSTPNVESTHIPKDDNPKRGFLRNMPSIYDQIVWISFHAVDFYVRFRHALKSALFEMYYYNAWTMTITNYALQTYNHIYYYWFSISVEPESSPWLNISYVTRKNTPEYLIHPNKPIKYIDLPPFSFLDCMIEWLQSGKKEIRSEEYQFREQYSDCPECTLDTNVIDRWNLMTSLVMCDSHTKSGIMVTPERVLCTYKTTLDQYIFRVSTNILTNNKLLWKIKDVSTLHLEDLQRSKIRFLSIEYTHPKMSYTIPLELHQEMMYVGNHLFSSAFVARMLNYIMGRNNFIFDMDYVIKIMDKELKYFELTYCQYICLEKNSYNVITEK